MKKNYKSNELIKTNKTPNAPHLNELNKSLLHFDAVEILRIYLHVTFFLFIFLVIQTASKWAAKL